ncbi:MAG: PEP-CTERM sorting domain-containing protein [Pseudomonadota bacterium]|nr:PEP-CTERM sorting domain-containing protein [Pseudomonadota bacterium]
MAVAASLLAITTLPAAASSLSTSGDTTGAPTFQRPVEDLSALSLIGTAAHYAAYAFTAVSSGVYGFSTAGSFDTFVVLYDGTFQPTDGLMNALIANDDLTDASFSVSGFDFALVAGDAYTYVVTGFDNDEYGSYTTTIVAPDVASVPEPATWALVAIGALAALRRRRLVTRNFDTTGATK